MHIINIYMIHVKCVLHKTHLMRTCKHKRICTAKLYLYIWMHYTKLQKKCIHQHTSRLQRCMFFFIPPEPSFSDKFSYIQKSTSRKKVPMIPQDPQMQKHVTSGCQPGWTGSEIHHVTPFLHPFNLHHMISIYPWISDSSKWRIIGISY